MKRYLTVLCTALVASALSIGMVQRPAIASSQLSPVPSVNIYLNTAYLATPEGLTSYCVVSGPNGMTEVEASCEDVLPAVVRQLQEKHPLVAFNFIIDGHSLGTI